MCQTPLISRNTYGSESLEIMVSSKVQSRSMVTKKRCRMFGKCRFPCAFVREVPGCSIRICINYR
jgi:hypothetical protein